MNNFKVVQQVEEYDCAAACVATILLNYFSLEASVFELKPIIKNSEAGTTFSDLSRGLKKLGMSTEIYQAELNIRSFDEINFPIITQIKTKDGFHYVVIFKKTNIKLIIGDPSENKPREISIKKFIGRWVPYIISIDIKKSKLRIFNPDRIYKISIWSYIKSVKFKIIFMILASIFSYIIGIFLSNMFDVYFDFLIPQKVATVIPTFMIIYLIVCLINQFLKLLQSFIYNNVSKAFDEKLLINYFEGILNKPRYAINEFGADELLTDVSNLPTIRTKILASVIQIPVDIIWLVFSLLILFKINFKLSLATIIMLLVLLYVTVLASRHYENISNDYINNITKLNNYLMDHIENMALIRELKVVNLFIAESCKRYNNFLSKRNKVLNFDALISNIRQTISTAFSIILFSLGAVDIVNGNLSTGSLLVFNSILGFTIDPLLDITGLQSLLAQGKVATYRVNSAMSKLMYVSNSNNLKHTICTNTKNFKLKNICFDRLSFSFDSNHKILNNISFYVNENSNVAITGNNGSGKTTIGKLICKLLLRDSGDIKFNNTSIDQIPENLLDEKLLFIDTNEKLINGSIEENINLSRGSSKEYILKISKEIGLLQDLNQSNISLSTQVGSKGTKLSFGQIQMIKVLQSTIVPRDIYVFDEITNGLDSTHSKLVINYLKKISGIKIFLTHDSSLVAQCDRELHIKNGSIEEVK